MKNQYNRIYIFCTFRSQLVLLLAFIIINLFNVANYAYAEGFGNLMGETVGFYARLEEDPNFIIQPPAQVQQVQNLDNLSPIVKEIKEIESQRAKGLYEYIKERDQARIANNKNTDPNTIQLYTKIKEMHEERRIASENVFVEKVNPIAIEPINKPAFLVADPNVVPVKTLYSLIKDDLDFEGAARLETLMRNLCLIETKYTQSNTADQSDNFMKDINHLFVDYKKATINDYENIRLAKIQGLTEAHVNMNERLLLLYKCSQGNPLMLHALTAYNTNQILFSLFNDPTVTINLDELKLKIYNDFLVKYQTEYKNHKEP